MDQQLGSLIAANVTFVGTHLALSHPLRRPLATALGEKGFLGLYSLVSLAALGWVTMAFRASGPGGDMLWDGQAALPWATASALALLAMVLLAGSFKGNPALPGAPAALARAEPLGVFAVTRHPMMWGFALWALAHILVSPSPRTLATAGGIGFLALVGAHLQDRKKEALMGADWQGWEAKTSYWPRWGRLAGVGAVPWLAGLALWLALTWAHVWLAYEAAGIWRWIG